MAATLSNSESAEEFPDREQLIAEMEVAKRLDHSENVSREIANEAGIAQFERDSISRYESSAMNPELRNHNRAHDPRTESEAKSMASHSVIDGEYQEVASEHAVAERPRSKSRSGKAKGKGKGEEVAQDSPETQTVSAPEASTAVNDDPANQQEPYFNQVAGGYAALSPTQREQCQKAYAKWGNENPEFAKTRTIEEYCSFRQQKFAEREAAAKEDVEKTVNEAGAPSEKSWKRQHGIENLTPSQLAQAREDFDALAAKNPKIQAHGFEKTITFIQDRVREDIALGAAARNAFQNVDKGAVQLTNSDLTRTLLEATVGKKANDQLRVLQASVENGAEKTERFGELFSINVQRKGDNSVLRTTLIPADGKHAEVKKALDKIANLSFAKARDSQAHEPKEQHRETKHRGNDMGR